MTRSIADSQMLAAAIEVVVEKGYVGATTRAIARAAGVNEATLFRRFGNKKVLVASAIRREAARFEALGIDKTGNVQADLVRVVRFYQELTTTKGLAIIALVLEANRHAELHEAMQVVNSVMAAVKDLLAAYQADGTLTAEPLDQAFVCLVGPLMVSPMIATTHPTNPHTPFDPEAYVARFIRGRTTTSSQ